MPKRVFKKRTFRKRKTFKRRPNLVRLIKKVMQSNAEKKYWDSVDAGSISSLGRVFPIDMSTNITVGDTQLQRIGSQIKLRNFNVKGKIDFLGNPLWSSSTVRLLVVQNLLPPPLILSNIIYNNAFTGSSINSQYRKETAGQYIILYDKRFTLSLEGPSVKVFNINVNKKLMKRIQFTNPASPGVVNKGELYVITISDIAVGSVPPTYEIETRLTFTDD